MRKLLQHITLFCCACLPATLGSCTSDLSPDDIHHPASEVGKMVDLSLNIKIGNIIGSPQTREEGSTEDKFSFEQSDIKYELINTLRVIIVRPDNTIEYNRTISLGLDEAVDVLKDMEDLKFRVSTDMGQVDNEAKTCTERKRIYLLANEAALNTFRSNVAGEGQSITKMLDDLRPAYYPPAQVDGKKEVGYRGDKLDPYAVERWIIYNEWPGGVDSSGEMALPIIDNTGETKTYIPMTEYFDVDVVSTWAQDDAVSGEDGNNNNQSILTIAEQNADLFVTRNFVKFQFSAYSDTEEFDITAITFEKVMQKEYLFPFNTVYSPAKSVNNTIDRQIISFQTPGFADNFVRPYIFEHEDKSPLLSFSPKVINGETGGETESESPTKIERAVYSPALYFCETNNIVSTADELQKFTVGVTVKYKNGDEATYEGVQLENLPYSLPRNTIVKVDMRLKDRKLAAVATVYPYTPVSLNPEFGFAPPVTDQLTVQPAIELELNGPDVLLYPTFTSTEGNTIQNLYWVSSNPAIILLGNEVTDPTDQRYVAPSASVELPYLQEVQDQQEPVPVRVIPQDTPGTEYPATAYVVVYSQSGLVARCRVTVK